MTNKEVYDLYKDPTLVAEIKKGRLCWTGHLERMPNTRQRKSYMLRTPKEKRHKGRPRLRWLEDVERDLQLMGVQSWKKKTGYVPVEVVRQARALDVL